MSDTKQYTFPDVPEGARRIRPLIWISNDGAGPGCVRVFADFPDGRIERIYSGAMYDADDAALGAELQAAREFYNV